MIVAVIVFVAIPSVLYLSLSKRKSPVTLGLILAGIHLAFVLLVTSVAFRYQGGDFTALVWFFPWLLDMPISLPFFPILRSLDFSGGAENLFCLAYFGVLGSAQYFLCGMLLPHLFGRKHSRIK